MQIIKDQVYTYLEYCRLQKKLNQKTIKAYGIDLAQFIDFLTNYDNQANKYSITKCVWH